MDGKLFSQFIIRDFISDIIMSTKFPIGHAGPRHLHPETRCQQAQGLQQQQEAETAGGEGADEALAQVPPEADWARWVREEGAGGGVGEEYTEYR